MYTAGLQMFASQNDSVYFRKRVLMGLSKRPWHHKREHLKESPRGKAGSKRRKAHNVRPKLTLFQRCSFFFLFIARRPTGSIRDSCVGNKFHARTSHEYIFYYFPSLPFFSPNWHGIHTYFTFYYFLRTCCSWRRRAILGALRLNDFKGFSWGFQRYLRYLRDYIAREDQFQTYIFMLKSRQYFNFSQCSLAIRLMFERWYLLDGDFCFRYAIVSGSEMRKK